MELKNIWNKVKAYIKKYQYITIVILVGIVLMSMPQIGKKDDTAQPVTDTESHESTMEERLGALLSRIEGAGEVCVMLTEAAGEEIFYQTNDNNSNGENSADSNKNTVIITDADRNQQGLVRKTNPPIYLGAVVVCRGGGNPSVKLAIVDAVSKVTGLGSNQISVIKMK